MVIIFIPSTPNKISSLSPIEGFASTVPQPRQLQKETVIPSTLPGKLPVAPYQQLASTSPLPYQDTSLVKANRQQLVSMLELLKGFLSFEAEQISERSDPAIQLPLSTARSDFQTLQSQIEVLNRNPGIQPTITLQDLNEMSSNLSYLQQRVRLTGNAGSLQGPIYEFFENQNSDTASLTDLNDLLSRLTGEILRLTASGTNDPIIQARVGALTKMKNDLKGTIDQVQSGAMMPVEIPIMKKDVDRAFVALGKPSEPLPQLIQHLRLPEGIANLLPSNLQKDPTVSRNMDELIQKYADTILNGISASFSVSYQPKTESTISITGFPSPSDLECVGQNASIGRIGKIGQMGQMGQMGHNQTQNMNILPTTDPLASLPSDAGRGPSHFDWKQRSKEIENQVKKRGLHSEDFGIMPKNAEVSSAFSWKGYAKMICTRLQATMDPGLPEMCGCPSMDWPGWRIS